MKENREIEETRWTHFLEKFTPCLCSTTEKPQSTTTIPPFTTAASVPMTTPEPRANYYFVAAKKINLSGTKHSIINYYEILNRDHPSFDRYSGVWTVPKDGTYGLRVVGISSIELKVDSVTLGFGNNWIGQGQCHTAPPAREIELKQGSKVYLFNPGQPFECRGAMYGNTIMEPYKDSYETDFEVYGKL